MSTLVMVRTVCCETYKCSGTRCSICPNRPENKESVESFKTQLSTAGFGKRFQISQPTTSV